MIEKNMLGKFIRTKREEARLSQKQFAEQLFVTESAVSKWERGVNYPDITMISDIMRIRREAINTPLSAARTAIIVRLKTEMLISVLR